MSDSFKTDEPRYERKFILNRFQTLSIHHLIKLHPAGFRELFEPRRINNIYYDTADFAHFRENIAGVTPRRKVRLRWYGDFDKIVSPTLEIKSKEGEVVTKSSHPVTTPHPAQVTKLLLGMGIKYEPVLINSYQREYYISADKAVRLTLDTLVTFDTPKTESSSSPRQSLAYSIIELKYPLDSESRASQIASGFPLRLTKSSKYEQGISLCYPHLTIL